MTALLAFFIVMNSLAKEQTGAAMYTGTGSFVASFANSGTAGPMPGNRSRDMVQQKAQKPIYALAENMEKNEHSVGPDDTNKRDRIRDREKEDFQKFLTKVEKEFGLEQKASRMSQVAFDSFEPYKKPSGDLSDHALQLLSEAFGRLRVSNSHVEIILWADMPSPVIMKKFLQKSVEVKGEVESKFWLEDDTKSRISYRAKPWLFTDAKRPVLSVIYSALSS